MKTSNRAVPGIFSQASHTLYERTPLRAITGVALRPGGVELTLRGLALCDFPKGARLLDLGCGPGATLELLAQEGYVPTGLDHSAALLREIPQAIPAVRADFAAIPFADAAFDGILCECVLSQAAEPGRVLAGCFRVLKPGGAMLLTDMVVGAPADCRSEPLARALLPCRNLSGARQDLLTLCADQGFRVTHAEDHSALLARLAAQIVWRFGSLKNFTAQWQACAGSADPGPAAGCVEGGADKYGYMLVVLTKGVHDALARH